jgi:ABC-type hemin transport system ATPase subunit
VLLGDRPRLQMGWDLWIDEFDYLGGLVRGAEFFAEFKWNLQPDVNILLGRNGYGKTQLLRPLVAMLQNDM